jgi:glutamine synthetase
MDKKEIIEEVKKYPQQKVKLAVTDIDGILRGKVMALDKFLSAADNGFGFCDVVFGWDAGDVVYDNVKFTGWHTGYPDAEAKIDMDTYRKVPWDNDIPFFLADFPSLQFCPRNLLKKIKKQALEAGFYPYFSQEFEWFNFKETPHSLADKKFKNILPLTPGMFGYSILRSSYYSAFFNDLFDLLSKFNVPIEGLHTETGPGVYEAAILYGDILEAADRAVLFKTGTKEIAYKHEIIASFMAKWNASLPGCSGHVHQSLWDTNKKQNLFFSSSAEGMSEIMKQYIAGQLYCLPHVLPMLAPTVNSFKRLVVGMWAPTTLTWAVDNRTVALRALPAGKKSCRLETRVCGSDTNPYLAMAACLASGLYGIKNKLKLQPATKGNGYEVKKHGVLPADLGKATQAMKKSKIAKELFGQEFVEHFCSTREWEWKRFMQQEKKFNTKEISTWEMQRYFEII